MDSNKPEDKIPDPKSSVVEPDIAEVPEYSEAPLWGIDLGGTKIEGIVLNPRIPNKPLARLRIPTEAANGYQHIVKRVAELVSMLSAACGDTPAAIGIGHPGVLDPRSQTIKNSNTVCLNGEPFYEDVQAALGCPVYLANDANCFTLAEATLGAGSETNAVFGIIMGTGVGGSIVINNHVLYGCQGIAGEWGHNPLVLDDPAELPGPQCYCGRRACVETVISGPALEQYYFQQTGKKLSLDKIRERIDIDAEANATIDRLLRYFGKAVAAVINILDPECIVLGGGISNIDLLYSRGPDEIRKHVFNDRLETRIVKNLLGDSAGVYGAALLTAEFDADAVEDEK